MTAATSPSLPADLPRQLRRLALRHRRWLAAGCAGLAVWAALADPAPTPPGAESSRLTPTGLALPVPLDDAAGVALLEPGVRVDVLGPTADGAVAVVARRVPVLSVPTADARDGLLGGTGGSGAVVLDVTEAQAIALTTAQSLGPLSVALHP